MRPGTRPCRFLRRRPQCPADMGEKAWGMHSLPIQQALTAGRAFMRGQGNRIHAWLVQKSERSSRLIGLAYKPGGKVEARCVYQADPAYADDLLLIAKYLMDEQGRAPQVYAGTDAMTFCTRAREDQNGCAR